MITRRVLGSFLSVMAGAIAGAVLTSIFFDAWWNIGFFALALMVVGCFVLPVWLLLVLPLYLLIPRTSILWRPWLCTVGGAALGALLLAGYGTFAWPDWAAVGLLLPIAGVVGGVTALFASLTAHGFHDDHLPLHAKA